MSGDHGGRKMHEGLRRTMGLLHPGRSTAEKEQPPTSQCTPGANAGVLNSRASPRPAKPVRSATLDVPMAPKQTDQEVQSQGGGEQTAVNTTAPALATLPALIPASTPPPPPPPPAPAPPPVSALAPAPAPASTTPAASAANPERRIGTRQPVDLQEERIRELKEQINELEERCEFYKGGQYRQELLSIRTHLQVNDLKEPWQISQEFQAINREVENVSRNLSEYLADRFQPAVPSFHTSDFVASSQTHSARMERSPAVSPEDFVDFRCRSLINEELMHTLFNEKLFHPALESGPNELLTTMYEKIQMQEPQIIAGRWRVSSFNAYKSIAFPYQDTAHRLCQDVILEFCRRIYGDKPAEEALNKVFPEITAIFKHAWSWYSSAKSSLVLLDFRPYYYPPGSPFDPEYTILEGRKMKPPSSKAILLTSRLGLISTEAQGGGKPPQQIVQAKATALTAEYFMSDR